MRGFPAWKLVADLVCVCVSVFSFHFEWYSAASWNHRIIFIIESYSYHSCCRERKNHLWGVLSGPFMWPKAPPSTEKGKSLHTSSLIVRGESILWCILLIQIPVIEFDRCLSQHAQEPYGKRWDAWGWWKPTPATSHLYGWCFLHRGQQPEHHHAQIFPRKIWFSQNYTSALQILLAYSSSGNGRTEFSSGCTRRWSDWI